MFIFQPPFASNPPKPTIILVSGAILHHISYSRFAEELSLTSGHRVLFPELASDASFDPAGETVEVDVAALREVILQQIDAGNEVVLVMHAYGSMVGGGAAKGLGKKQRGSEGKAGGVVGVICVAGFLVEGGASVRDVLLAGGTLESTEEYPIGDPIPTGYTNPLHPAALYRQLYNTGPPVPESSFRATFSKMLSEGKLRLTSASPELGFADEGFDGRRAYIYATQDTCLTLPQQLAMVEDSGVVWIGEVLEAGHDVCKTHTMSLVELVAVLIEEFAAVGGKG